MSSYRRLFTGPATYGGFESEREIQQMAQTMMTRELQYTPTAHLNKDVVAKAIEMDALQLRYVPYELKTAELCARAVEQNGEAIAFVPEKCMTVDMCRRAMKTCGRMYEKLPKAFKEDPVVKMLAVTSSPNMLELMEQTSELCEMAVHNSSRALMVAKKELKTFEMCRTALEREITKARGPNNTSGSNKQRQVSEEQAMYEDARKSDNPFWGIGEFIPAEFRKDETIAALLEELYTLGNFEKVGPMRVNFSMCRQSYPCSHSAIDETGEYRSIMGGNEIANVLLSRRLRHPHFDYLLADRFIDTSILSDASRQESRQETPGQADGTYVEATAEGRANPMQC